MELKVFKDTIASYGGRWETRLELPVETEILIPDYLPAVFKIVKCLITPVVLQNRVSGGRWQSEGYLRCTVYYQSEEPGTRLLRTEQKFAFEKLVELPACIKSLHCQFLHFSEYLCFRLSLITLNEKLKPN